MSGISQTGISRPHIRDNLLPRTLKPSRQKLHQTRERRATEGGDEGRKARGRVTINSQHRHVHARTQARAASAGVYVRM